MLLNKCPVKLENVLNSICIKALNKKCCEPRVIVPDNQWNREGMASTEPMIQAEDLDFGGAVDQIDATRTSRSSPDLVNEYRRRMPSGFEYYFFIGCHSGCLLEIHC